MSYALGYDPCFKCDKKDVLCSMCELTYHRNKQIADEGDLSKLQIVNIDNYKADVDKLKELLEKNPGRVGIIPVDSLPDVEVIERPPYCKFCFNARVYQPTEDDLLTGNTLDDTNDSSSIVVGEHMRPYRSIMINSGNGEPLNIEFLEWAVTRDRWETVGKYYPKFCPECGRRLDEYDKV